MIGLVLGGVYFMCWVIAVIDITNEHNDDLLK